MRASPPPSLSAIVDRLRSAGCVFAEDEARLLTDAANSPAQLEQMIARRVAGLPLEQILGWAEFCGLRIVVVPGVFVPRRRTEFLVAQAIATLLGRPDPAPDRAAVAIDLCCGSGAVGAAIAAQLPGTELYAADIDPVAADCAGHNVGAERVFLGDLYDPLPAELLGRVDMLVVNAPYVPTDAVSTMPPEARLYEPLASLDGGTDGLDVQRRVAAGAPEWLAVGGHLLIETSARQARSTAAMLVASGFSVRVARSDELDATVVIGRHSG